MKELAGDSSAERYEQVSKWRKSSSNWNCDEYNWKVQQKLLTGSKQTFISIWYNNKMFRKFCQ